MKHSLFRTHARTFLPTSIRTLVRTSLLSTLLLISGTTGFVAATKSENSNGTQVSMDTKYIKAIKDLKKDKIKISHLLPGNKIQLNYTLSRDLKNVVSMKTNTYFNASENNKAEIKVLFNEIFDILREKCQIFYQESSVVDYPTGLKHFENLFNKFSACYKTLFNETPKAIDSSAKLKPSDQLVAVIKSLVDVANAKTFPFYPKETINLLRNLVDDLKQTENMDLEDLAKKIKDDITFLTTELVTTQLKDKDQDRATLLNEILQAILDMFNIQISVNTNNSAPEERVDGGNVEVDNQEEETEPTNIQRTRSTSPDSVSSSSSLTNSLMEIDIPATPEQKSHPTVGTTNVVKGNQLTVLKTKKREIGAISPKNQEETSSKNQRGNDGSKRKITLLEGREKLRDNFLKQKNEKIRHMTFWQKYGNYILVPLALVGTASLAYVAGPTLWAAISKGLRNTKPKIQPICLPSQGPKFTWPKQPICLPSHKPILKETIEMVTNPVMNQSTTTPQGGKMGSNQINPGFFWCVLDIMYRTAKYRLSR